MLNMLMLAELYSGHWCYPRGESPTERRYYVVPAALPAKRTFGSFQEIQQIMATMALAKQALLYCELSQNITCDDTTQNIRMLFEHNEVFSAHPP